MRKPFSSESPPLRAERPPHSLATIAAALAACRHPDRLRISATVLATARPVRITWCADCGAMRSSEDGPRGWQPSALATLLAKSHFEELSATLRTIRKCAELASTPRVCAACASPPGALVRELHSVLIELAETPIVQEVEHLDAAIARIPELPRRLAS